MVANLKSTQAMRSRVKELMSKEKDDYDIAVECILDDLEICMIALEEIISQGSDLYGIAEIVIGEDYKRMIENEKNHTLP